MMVPSFVVLAFLLWVPMFAEAENAEATGTAAIQNKDSVLLSKLSKVRIVLKDGTMKKNCKVVEIKSYWIVYEKDGSLHDLMIESIERIEIQDGKMEAVFFDDKHKPRIGSYVY